MVEKEIAEQGLDSEEGRCRTCRRVRVVLKRVILQLK